jgi:hypothetical protein
MLVKYNIYLDIISLSSYGMFLYYSCKYPVIGRLIVVALFGLLDCCNC